MWGLIALGIVVLLCALAGVCIIVILGAFLRAIIKARKKYKGSIDTWG